MSFLSNFVESMFFREDSRTYWSPRHFGIDFQEIKIPNNSTGSIRLWILNPEISDALTKSKGTVLYFNPAQLNISYAITQILFLVEAGFTVVLFDYRGSGKSEGHISLDGMEKDAEEVYKYLSELHQDGTNLKKFFVFGQGTGADAALRFSLAHPKEVCGVAVESAYASQRGWLKERYGPVLGDIAANLLKPSRIQPEDAIISLKCPVLVIEPGKDDYVRNGQRKRLRECAPKNSEFWNVPGKAYLHVFSGNFSDIHKRFISFISHCFNPKPHPTKSK